MKYAVLILVIILGLAVSLSKCHLKTFWITPSNQQGCGNRTPCNTIEGYYKGEKDIFSTPNTVWIFLRGNHTFFTDIPTTSTKNYLSIINVYSTHNVTFKGETSSTTLHLGVFNITNSENIEIDTLRIRIEYNGQKGNKRYGIILTYISGLKISNTHIQSQIKRAPYLPVATVCLFFPVGTYEIKNCVFSNVYYLIRKYPFRGSNVTGYEQINLSSYEARLLLYNVVFHYSSLNFTRTFSSYKKVSLNIHNCTFLKSEVNIELIVIINPVNVTLDSCYFHEGMVTLMAQVKTMAPLYDLVESELLVFNSMFNNTPIKIGHNPKYVDTFYKLSMKYLLKLHKCTFTGFKPRGSERETLLHVLTLDLADLPLALSISELDISENKAGAMKVINSQLKLKGLNMIERNNVENSYKIQGIVEITDFTRILFQNNSKLVIRNNTGYTYGAVATSPVQMPYGRYKDYIPYYSYSSGHGGNCFFQLLNQTGKLLFNSEDIAYFNASIDIVENEGSIHMYRDIQIYNGHLYQCNMESETENITTSLRLLKTFIHLPYESWNSSFISSPPYSICLCDPDKVNDTLLWKCSIHSTITIEYGQHLVLYAAVISDYGEIQTLYPVKVTIIYKNDSLDSHLKELKLHTCVEVLDLSSKVPLKNVIIETKSEAFYFKTFKDASISVFNIQHLIDVEVVKCPLGLTLNSNTKSCDCDTVLKDHSFTCNLNHGGDPLYLQTINRSTRSSWIGLSVDKQSLTFSTNCPLFFCNNMLQNYGVTLSAINSTSKNDPQCSNRRTGISCSVCPKGYSSTIGSYECEQCTQPSFVYISILNVVFGLVLISLLFLFNLTIVQGTINGISFYANIMYLYEDIILQYAGAPFYNIILFLNFGTTFQSCFYDGMNEYDKNWLRFFFPFYLLLIVVVIIIGAHKCNLRVFKVTFIAKRAVPVLATLMVLTYTNILGIVMDSLRRYTLHIYNRTTYQSYTVWLYQPSLAYFQGKHLALAVFSIIVTVFYLIPLPMVILFGDLLRKYIHNLWFGHFLDVFHGAYRWPFGFWLGVRLLVRVTLMVLNVSLPSNWMKYPFVFSFIFAIYITQVYLKPFRKQNINRVLKDEALNKSKFKFKLLKTFKWLVKLKISDGILLIILIILCGLSCFVHRQRVLLRTVYSITVSAAMIQIILVIVNHSLQFFPIPQCLLEWWKQNKLFLFPKTSETANEIALSSEDFSFHAAQCLLEGRPQENESTKDETS